MPIPRTYGQGSAEKINGLVPFALTKEHGTQVAESLQMGGILPEGLAKGFDGLYATSSTSKGNPKAGVGLGQPLPQEKSLLLGGDGCVNAALHPMDDPQGRQGVGIIRLDSNGPGQQSKGFFDPACLTANDAKPMTGDGMAAMAINELAIDRLRGLQLTELLQ
jgi:hypothetical protein